MDWTEIVKYSIGVLFGGSGLIAFLVSSKKQNANTCENQKEIGSKLDEVFRQLDNTNVRITQLEAELKRDKDLTNKMVAENTAFFISTVNRIEKKVDEHIEQCNIARAGNE